MGKITAVVVTFIMMMSASAQAANTISYPSRAWSLNQSGYVDAVYDIDGSGKAVNVRIKDSNPAFLFDDSVKQQIYRWRFQAERPQKNISIRVNFTRK